MDQMQKQLLKNKLIVASSQISAAKGLANIPAQPHVPVVALQPIVNALEEIVKSIESVIDNL